MEISFTRLRIFRECPWKYKLMFLEGRRIPLDPPASLGISLHRALERYHRGGQSERRDLEEVYDQEFLRSGYPDAAAREQWRQKGLRILKRYWEEDSSRRTEVVGVEREFVYPLGRHTVRGMVDRLDRHPDGRYELIDYKTRFGLDPQPPAQAPVPAPDADLQLRFYALGVKTALSISPALLSVHYLAANRVETRPYDPSGEEALRSLISETADAIEKGAFSPDASFCRRCGFRNDCEKSAAADS